jgi:GH15 family glucan-1,4-alpha-glucosidase
MDASLLRWLVWFLNAADPAFAATVEAVKDLRRAIYFWPCEKDDFGEPENAFLLHFVRQRTGRAEPA